MPPWPGRRLMGQAGSFDEKAALKVKGVIKVVPTPMGIAVCAKTLDAAWKGRDALKVQWGQGHSTDGQCLY